MKVTLDLKQLLKLDLSPTEYITLLLIDENKLFEFPISEGILDNLRTKGWLDDNKKLLKSFKEEEMIDQWLSLWPTFRIPQGYRISGNYLDCKDRMKKFIKKYGYSWDIIMKATKNYLDRQKMNNWNMTKKNLKFIYDNDGSILAEECEALIGGEDSEEMTNQSFI